MFGIICCAGGLVSSGYGALCVLGELTDSSSYGALCVLGELTDSSGYGPLCVLGD